MKGVIIMDTIILDSIDFKLDLNRILEKLHMDEESEDCLLYTSRCV